MKISSRSVGKMFASFSKQLAAVYDDGPQIHPPVHFNARSYFSPVFVEPEPTPEDFEKRAIAALDKIEVPKFSRRLERRLARGRR